MTGPTPDDDRTTGRLVDLRLSRQLARLMDDLVTVPGTRVGLGLDALIGLVPGIGDLVGSTLSGAIVYDAVRCRVPVPTLARMGANLLLDAVLGLVPFAGDLLDVAHRANRKNLRLLERAVAANPDPGPPTVGYVLAAVALVVLPLVLALVLGLVALWFLLRWVLG
ncbi:MAG: DUF4112 domain-containing protein [Nocardioidaceae bacterium]